MKEKFKQFINISTVIKFIFTSIGLYGVLMWKQIEPGIYFNPMIGLFSFISVIFVFLITLLLFFLSFKKGKFSFVVVMFLSSWQLSLGWNKIIDPCYEVVVRGKGSEPDFLVRGDRVCITSNEKNSVLYWTMRSYNPKDNNLKLDVETFEFIGENRYRDKNCLYEVKESALECIEKF